MNVHPCIDPCLGFIIREHPRTHPRQYHSSMTDPSSFRPNDELTEGRTLVILGDTSDPSALVPLIKSNTKASSTSSSSMSLSSDDEEIVEIPHFPTVSLLIHEATDCYIPPHIDSRGTTGKNRSFASVEMKAQEKGHSTPGMAGAFAKLIGAERLVLNHIGSRYVTYAMPIHRRRRRTDRFCSFLTDHILDKYSDSLHHPFRSITNFTKPSKHSGRHACKKLRDKPSRLGTRLLLPREVMV